MSKIYVLTDLQTSESFDSVNDAQDRLNEWMQDALQNAKDFVDGQEYSRLYDEYTREESDSDMIRLWEVDLDVYDGKHDDCGYWPSSWDEGAEVIEERSTHNDEIRAIYRDAMENAAGANGIGGTCGWDDDDDQD